MLVGLFPYGSIVLINDYSEIGCGSTIDRGSISNTVIGKNTYLDNQVHVAHNVQIGKVSDLAARIRGEEEVAQQSNDRTAFWLVVFMVVFLVLGTASMYYYKDV